MGDPLKMDAGLWRFSFAFANNCCAAASVKLRLLQLEGRLHEQQKNSNSWKGGDKPRI